MTRAGVNIRAIVLEVAATVRELIGRPSVAERWDLPSALEMMTIGELTAHLTRALTTTARYLDAPDPGSSDDLVTPARYYTAIDDLTSSDGPDLGDKLHVSIRERARQGADHGHAGVLESWDETMKLLGSRFTVEAADRRVAVFGGRMMSLDDYLVTRLVELVVHTDDLAVSLGVAPPPLPAEAHETVIGCLVDVALERHGPMAVIRAMTRTERDSLRALRVL